MHSTDTAVGQAAEISKSCPQVTLEITRGRARQKRREVRSRAFLIGSAPDSDLVLGDPRFDELHSYVFLTPSKVTIRQLGGGPALCVGEQETPLASLEDHDRLRMGPYEFQLQIQWRTLQQRKPRPAEAVIGQTPVTVDNDPALERLLRDIEQFASGPPVRLFLGENGQQPGTPARTQGAPPADIAASRSSARRASN